MRQTVALKTWIVFVCFSFSVSWIAWGDPPTVASHSLPLELQEAPDILRLDDTHHLSVPATPPDSFIPDHSPEPPTHAPPVEYTMLQLDNVTAYQSYVNGIHTKLRQNWRPRGATGRVGGKTVVHFELDEQGHVQQMQVTETSGSKKADDLALQAIQHAEPFQEFPKSLQMDKLVVQYTFDFFKPY